MDFHTSVNAVVLQGANHFEAGAVANVSEAWIAMAAEIPLENFAVFGAVEKRAPRFEFAHALRRFFGVQLSHAPVIEVLAATHRIGEMDAPVVAIIDVGESGGDAAFGHHGVGFAQQRFAHYPHFRAGSRGFDGGAQACAARSDHQDIVREPLEFRHLQDSPVMPDADGTEADIEIGKPHPEKAEPRPAFVSAVQAADAVVQLVPYRVFGNAVERSSDEMPERVAAEDVSGQEYDIHYQNDGADTDSEAVRKTERYHGVVDQETPYEIGEPQEITVKILQDQRKASFPQVALARFAYRAGRGIGPE